MKKIIERVNRNLIEKELTNDKFLRYTNFGENSIYVITAHDSPNIMQEIGRLREITFRLSGGGTGKDLDVDAYDTHKKAFKQLVVWNPKDKEFVGGYRFIKGKDMPIDENGKVNSATSNLFKLSDKFVNDYLPFVIELGRSFIQPKYQPSTTNRKGIFSLDNLWDGLGALIVDNSDIKYFFGKVTVYTSYNWKARNMLLFFLRKFFPDKENLVTPLKPVLTEEPDNNIIQMFEKTTDYKESYKILNKLIRELGENIPPLINSYMNLSNSMKTFGTTINNHFGNVEETSIMINISDIYESKKQRHVDSYLNQKK